MKFYRRNLAMFIGSAVIALLLQACMVPTPPRPLSTQEAGQTEEPVAAQEPAPPQETVKLTVVTQPFITFVPFYIAQQEGYYAEQGLEVEFVNFVTNQEILPALSSGQVDVSSGLLSSGMLTAMARGGNFKIVADKGYIDPAQCDNYVMIARKDLVEAGAFQNVADLKGHTVDVVPATWQEYYLAELLETGGLTLKDIQMTDLPPPAEPEAFEKKAMELSIISEPWIIRFREAGHSPVFAPPSKLVPDTEAAVILYGPTLLGENADLGNRFMVAYLKAVRQYNEGKTPRNVELVAQFTELDPALLETMCWPTLRSGGELNVQSVLDFQQWAIDAGYLDTSVSPEQFWDGSFVTHANAELDQTP
jgi:NitT/TauT family transport system substrate-binding protein